MRVNHICVQSFGVLVLSIAFGSLISCTVSPNSGQAVLVADKKTKVNQPTSSSTNSETQKSHNTAAVQATVDSESCLDISGDYKIPQELQGIAKTCTENEALKEAFYQVRQNDCSDVRWIKIYKLTTGEDCIEEVKDYIIDGAEHEIDNKTSYTYETTETTHTISYKNLISGQKSSEIHSLDANGNLNIKDATGKIWLFKHESK